MEISRFLAFRTKMKVAIARDLQIGAANVRDYDYDYFEPLEIITIVHSGLDLVYILWKF